MDRMLYVSMSGAKQLMLAQAVNANNLANVNTAGFRADLMASMQQPVYGPGHESRIYSELARQDVDLAPGTIATTGRDLDIAVDGDGYLVVQAPDGSEAYTRAGDLQLTSSGQLVTGAGYPVMGNGGPIAVPPFEKLDIGVDGTVAIRPVGQSASALAAVDRIRLVKPEPGQLTKNEYGLLVMRDGGVAPDDATVTLLSGSVETSNVNAVHAMANMIELARQYEMQVKMMKTADENATTSARLLSFS